MTEEVWLYSRVVCGGQGQGCSLYRIQVPGGGHRERGPDPDQPPDLVAEGASLGLHGPLHPQVLIF